MKTKSYFAGKCQHCGMSNSVLMTKTIQVKTLNSVTETTHEVSISKCGNCKKDNTIKEFERINKSNNE